MIWKCNTCGKTKGVKSGMCPDDGSCQTTPMDEEARKAAGVVSSEPKEVEHTDEAESPSPPEE